tara:strand:- start:3936 stop:4664 length:729 start_codon:yes stop_codon:yes gene_type:complete
MDDEKLLKEYIKLFGDQPPFPPIHIMKTLVEMKKGGTFDSALEAMAPQFGELRKGIEDITGQPMSLDNPFFDMDFRESGDDKISLPDTFKLFTEKILTSSTKNYLDLFRDMNMEEIEFVVKEHEKHLPEFQSGFTFKFKTDHEETCFFEIRDIENQVLELAIIIQYKKGWFKSNMSNQFNVLKELCDSSFTFNQEKGTKERKILGWEGEGILVSIRKLKTDIEQLSFVVGNKELWSEILRNG